MKGDEFFRPLWLRLAIVAACAAWSAFEWVNGETGWAALAAAATLYGAWSLLIAYRPRSADGTTKDPESRP